MKTNLYFYSGYGNKYENRNRFFNMSNLYEKTRQPTLDHSDTYQSQLIQLKLLLYDTKLLLQTETTFITKVYL